MSGSDINGGTGTSTADKENVDVQSSKLAADDAKHTDVVDSSTSHICDLKVVEEMESTVDNKGNGEISSKAGGSGNSSAAKSDSIEDSVGDDDKKCIIDPYAYVNRSDFTSEKFKIEIRGLPKFYGYGELKKFLNDKLKLSSNKVKPAKRSPCVFVCFRNEEDRQAAIKTLNHLTWKGKTLSASTAKPAPDPLVRKRKLEHEAGESDAKKKPRICDAEKLQNSTTPFWNLSYDEQLKKKYSYIKKVMCQLADQIARLNPMLRTWMGRQKSKYDGMACNLLDIRKSPTCDGYRNKCEFTIGINEETKQRMVGFRLGSYVQGHVGVGPIDSLKHIPQRMKETVKVFEKFIQESAREPFNPETHTGHWRQLTLRLTTMDELMVVVVANLTGSSADELASAKKEVKAFFESKLGKELRVTSLYFQAIGKREAGKEPPMEHLMGATHITESLLGLKFRISPEAFFQVNTPGAGVLYNAVGEMMDLNPSTTVVDVCCGTGTIGLSLAKKCGQVLGLEVVAPAIEDAKVNAAENNITNCEFFTGRAEEILTSVLSRAKGTSVYAVVDPPRSGLQQKGVVALRGAKIDQVVYVSCDPNAATKNFIDLARQMSKQYHGYPMVPVCAVPVDMFPHTAHCEVVILFHRINPNNLPMPLPTQESDTKILSDSLSKHTQSPSKSSDPEKKEDNINETGRDLKSSENPGNKNYEKSHSSLRHLQDRNFKQSSKERPGHIQRLPTRDNMSLQLEREPLFNKQLRIDKRPGRNARLRSHTEIGLNSGPVRGEEFTHEHSFSHKPRVFEKSTLIGGERNNFTKERISRADFRDGSYERSRIKEEPQFMRRCKPADKGSREKSPQPWSEEVRSRRKWRDDRSNTRSTNTPQKGERWSRPRREIDRPGQYQGMESNSRRSGRKSRERERRVQRSRTPQPKFRADMRRGDDDYPRNDSRGRGVRPGFNEEEEHWRNVHDRAVESSPCREERNFTREDDYAVYPDGPCSNNGMYPFDVNLREEWCSNRGVSPIEHHGRDDEVRRGENCLSNIEDGVRFGRRDADRSPIHDMEICSWEKGGMRRQSHSPVRRYQTVESEMANCGHRRMGDENLVNRLNNSNASARHENEEKPRYARNNYSDFDNEQERLNYHEVGERNLRMSSERIKRSSGIINVIEEKELLHDDYQEMRTESNNEGTAYIESRSRMLFQERDLINSRHFQPMNKPVHDSYNETAAMPILNYRGRRNSGYANERDFIPNSSPPKQHILDNVDSGFSLKKNDEDVFRGPNESRMQYPLDLDRFRSPSDAPMSQPLGVERATPMSYSNTAESGGDYRKHCETNLLGRNYDNADELRRQNETEDMVIRRVEMVRRPVVVGDKYGMLLNGPGKPLATAEVLLITAKNHMYDKHQSEWGDTDESISSKLFVQQTETPQPKHWDLERPRESPAPFMKSSSPVKNCGNGSDIHGNALDDRSCGLWLMDRSNEKMPSGWRDLEQVSGARPNLIRDSHISIPDANISNFTFHKRDVDERRPNINPAPSAHSGFSVNAAQNNLEESFSFRPAQAGFIPNTRTLQPSHQSQTAENNNRDFLRNGPSQPRLNENIPHYTVANNFKQGATFHDVSNIPLRPPPFTQNPSEFINSSLQEPRQLSTMIFKQTAPVHDLLTVHSGVHEIPTLKPSSNPGTVVGGPWNTRGINPWMISHQPPLQQKQW